jgi:hypothetical protein
MGEKNKLLMKPSCPTPSKLNVIFLPVGSIAVMHLAAVSMHLPQHTITIS